MTPAETARRLVRAADRASLATLMDGAPYASLVLVACDPEGAPLLLISRLAQHRMNIERDDRVSLLIDGTAGLEEPLTGSRVTLQGRAEPTTDAALQARYIARHPSAAGYAGFSDFGLFRVRPERAHLVAGFGRISWVEDMIAAPAPALAAAEHEIVKHMNEDHADAVDLYATRLLGRSGTGWRMTGIDAEGADLRRAGEIARLDFPRRIEDPGAARAVLVELVGDARAER